MGYPVSSIDSRYDFSIEGASYIGSPRPNTVMYVSGKVGFLLENLKGVDNCLVFVQKELEIDQQLERKHCIVLTDNPQLSYARFAEGLLEEREQEECRLGYQLTKQGYYRSRSAIVGENARIEPGVLIGHHVIIGKNACIKAGAIIKNATIGDDFVCCERAVVGSWGFTMAEDERGDKYRIPTLGRVVIGNHVEIGVSSNICCGCGGDTLLEDCVKIDACVYIGHDARLLRNAEITAGVTIGGFAVLEEGAFVGVGSNIRNRILIGAHAVIGMGANVTKSVESHITVAGNPARPLNRIQ